MAKILIKDNVWDDEFYDEMEDIAEKLELQIEYDIYIPFDDNFKKI